MSPWQSSTDSNDELDLVSWPALTMVAKLSSATLMLVKSYLPLKSIAAAAVLTACLPSSSLAATKWAKCTGGWSTEAAVVHSYEVELKTDSEKISLIRTTQIIRENLKPGTSGLPDTTQIIAKAAWFPTEVVIGPFPGIPFTITKENGELFTHTSDLWLKISRQTLSWDQGVDILGAKSWYGLKGSCRIIPSPVKTLF